MAKEQAVVTGGGGFIGSHLVERLLELGYRVKVVDNFSNGKVENLGSVANNKSLEIHDLDIREYEPIKKIFKGARYVFHLAALADIVPSIESPESYFDTNVKGTLNIVESARKNNVEKVIYSASSSCYGVGSKPPFSEKSEISTEYPYALTKYLGEQILIHWGNVYGTKYVSLRLFNVYGPRSRTSGTYGAVFGVFLAQKLAQEPFTVVGNGKQKRDFVFVTDVVDAFVKASQSKKINFVANIGSGKAHSVNYLTTLLEGEKVHLPKRPGEPYITLADISLARKILKWEPKTTFEDGVKIMLENIDYWSKAPLWNEKRIAGETKSWFKYLS